MLIIDGHADTLSVSLDENKKLVNPEYSFNLPDALNKAPYVQTLATFIHPKYVKQNIAFKRTKQILDKFHKEYGENKDTMLLIKDSKDLQKVIDNKLVGIILSIENGSAIEGNLNNIEYLYDIGIRIMSLTWNEDNNLACGASTQNDTGITSLGKEYIKKLEKKKILIDVSHASEKSFYDIFKITNSPIIATHSCAKSLCNHKRNLTNDQIKQIANTGGTVGICFYNKFLTEKKDATITDITNHIEHIASLVGINYISLGTDFEGIERKNLPIGITGVRDLENLFVRLKDRGFKQEDIEKIAGGNLKRVLQQGT